MIGILRRKARIFSLITVVSITAQIVAPTTTYALTGGPTQPEVQSFQPAGTNDMVDLFSGDFSYNIPLFELPGPNGGYPFNLSYQSGISMDQEASWVGLGWSLQPGAITRQIRGIPDEFNGDPVTTRTTIRPNTTAGLGVGLSIELFGGDGSLGLGMGFYENSYRGLGCSMDATLGFEQTGKGSMTGGLSLGLSFDSQEGVGVNPSLSLGSKIGEVGIGCGYNSKQGFGDISYQYSKGHKAKNGAYVTVKNKVEGGKSHSWGENNSLALSSMISLAHPGYTPTITMPMNNLSFSATLKAGGSWWGIFGAPYINGYYTTQTLVNDNTNVTTPAFGYMNYQNANTSSVIDVNREKDGMVTKETSNLGVPSQTYDVYSVSGQGIGMMYRPMRNDYGTTFDKKTSSTSTSIGAGVDLGPAATHIGINLNVNYSTSTSGRWDDDNYMIGATEYQKKTKSDLYEPWYFKVHGQPSVEPTSTLDNVGADRAVRVQLIDNNRLAKANATLEYVDQGVTKTLAAPANAWDNRSRKSRTNAISSLTNAELLKADGTELLPFLKVNYIAGLGSGTTPFVRSTTLKDHFAAHVATTADGLRYVYGLPAYNKLQKEVEFSTIHTAGQALASVSSPDGSNPKYNTGDQFLKQTTLPPYAHSHLLTSILGPDYVDVTGDGVTPDDLGYWVKFTYRRTSTDYKWREPFSKAHFQDGWMSTNQDDRGSYVSGTKEMWYLAVAETKSHVAVFDVFERRDGHGALSEVQDADQSDPASPTYGLKTIRLYTRSSYVSATPSAIKTTNFDYDYSLCGLTPNNDQASAMDNGVDDNINHGKLTLKKVWFEYGNSKKGSLNPYKFNYYNESGSVVNYSLTAYDRWGGYRQTPTAPNDDQYYQHNPYVDQNPNNKTTLDANAATWSIKQITLPSGGTISLDYETDDYAYVQNKTAMQMMQMVNPTASPNWDLDPANLVVKFKLETPLASTVNQRTEVLKYIDRQNYQLYFKMLVNLRKASEPIQEYISGYADIDPNGSMGLSDPDGNGNFTNGFFTLRPERGYHPFSLRAWQHLRTNQPELANSGIPMTSANNNKDMISQIKSLIGSVALIKQMLSGFNVYCSNHGWGKRVDPTHSWVRLNSPDKIKYGGGVRVKQITMRDQWTDDEEGVYGQLYDYTTVENGITISSGVAAYEPMAGGDENALHFAKKYTQSIPLKTDNNLYFEYPVNESYYPGPQVGYSKVTVMSLASASRSSTYNNRVNAQLSDGALFPAGQDYGTTGKTVHEFFTAKDFPVITDETDKYDKQYKLSVPIPFLGSLSMVKLTSSQGYSIITNDMHGKQKGVSTYRQVMDQKGSFEEQPISWVRYNYRSTQVEKNRTNVSVLNNVLYDHHDGTLDTLATDPNATTVHFNQETEFFHDMRQFNDVAWGGGARYNTDIVYIPIIFGAIPLPVPSIWPSVSRSTSTLRTTVSNKVIFRGGILSSIEAYDGSSKVKTMNLKWDKLTGGVLLSSVTNNFDKPVYTYNRPAYLEYQGMGAAYQNIGFAFEINGVKQDATQPTTLYRFTTDNLDPLLQPGDEIALYAFDTYSSPLAVVVYLGRMDGSDVMYSETSLTSTDYNAMIVRSGYRNILSASGGSITGLQDPSVMGATVTKQKTITVPKKY